MLYSSFSTSQTFSGEVLHYFVRCSSKICCITPSLFPEPSQVKVVLSSPPATSSISGVDSTNVAAYRVRFSKLKQTRRSREMATVHVIAQIRPPMHLPHAVMWTTGWSNHTTLLSALCISYTAVSWRLPPLSPRPLPPPE